MRQRNRVPELSTYSGFRRKLQNESDEERAQINSGSIFLVFVRYFRECNWFWSFQLLDVRGGL